MDAVQQYGWILLPSAMLTPAANSSAGITCPSNLPTADEAVLAAATQSYAAWLLRSYQEVPALAQLAHPLLHLVLAAQAAL